MREKVSVRAKESRETCPSGVGERIRTSESPANDTEASARHSRRAVSTEQSAFEQTRINFKGCEGFYMKARI